jgi:hypothetical protein
VGTVGPENAFQHDGELRRGLARRENEAVFAATEEPQVDAHTRFPFLCECADPHCREYMKLTLNDYRAARRIADFVIAPSHSQPADRVFDTRRRKGLRRFIRRSAVDRRSGTERRVREDGPPGEERRSGKDRRAGTDRRSGSDQVEAPVLN